MDRRSGQKGRQQKSETRGWSAQCHAASLDTKKRAAKQQRVKHL
jgi:hypothetical protein